MSYDYKDENGIFTEGSMVEPDLYRNAFPEGITFPGKMKPQEEAPENTETRLEDVATGTISKAMRILSEDIVSEDGVSNMACLQAADRLDDLEEELVHLKWNIAKLVEQYGRLLV